MAHYTVYANISLEVVTFPEISFKRDSNFQLLLNKLIFRRFLLKNKKKYIYIYQDNSHDLEFFFIM